MKKRMTVTSSIRVVLILTVFLVPLFSLNYLPYVTIEKTLLFYGLVEAAFCLWLYALLQNKAQLPPRSPVLIAGGVFLGLYTLAGIVAVSPEIAFWSTMSRMSGLILLFHIAALVLVLVSTVRDEKTWRRIMGAVSVSGALAALPTHLVFFFPEHETALIDTTFGNSSYAAAFLTFSFFFSLILFFFSKVRHSKVFFAACAAVILSSPLLVTLSGFLYVLENPIGILGTARAASLSVFVGLVLAGLAYGAFAARQAISRMMQVCFVVCAILLIALSVAVLVPGSAAQEKLDEAGIGSRVLFWESALTGVAERPLLGYGPEHYFVPFYQHFNPALLTEAYAYETFTSKPHSAYLEILVSGGVLSFVAYLAMMTLAFTLLWRIMKEGILLRSETALLIGLLGAYLLQNILLFDTLSSYLGIGIVLAYLVYVSSVHRDGVSKTISTRRVSWPQTAIILGLWTALMYFFVVMPLLQQRMLVRVLEQVTVVERPLLYADLFELSPHAKTSMAEYLMAKVLTAVPVALQNATAKERALILEDVSALRRTVETYSVEGAVHYRFVFYLARLHLLESILQPDGEKREELLATVRTLELSLERLSPGNPQNYWITAQRELLEGDTQAALTTLRETDAHAPDIATTQEMIAQIETYLGGEGNVPFFIN